MTKNEKTDIYRQKPVARPKGQATGFNDIR